MLAQLISDKGDRTIRITQDITVVGRRPEVCDLVIPSDSISKIHSVISKTDGLLFVRDLGSTNGTRVNGQRVTRGALLPGDELAFASVKYKVHLGPTEQEGPEIVGHGDRTEVIPTRPPLKGEGFDEDSVADFPIIDENE
ncbi:MAG: FHA domain-containing protein [Planctomycetaceae bacterium]|nr:FHA domain-containing protein [Planctomycetaceae bacterium]